MKNRKQSSYSAWPEMVNEHIFDLPLIINTNWKHRLTRHNYEIAKTNEILSIVYILFKITYKGDYTFLFLS